MASAKYKIGDYVHASERRKTVTGRITHVRGNPMEEDDMVYRVEGFPFFEREITPAEEP